MESIINTYVFIIYSLYFYINLINLLYNLVNKLSF
uniref:Uncharacterized protein n=1 Tax=Ophidocladus simpliciusculus TaxID=1261574 RepID=A0A1Z1MJ46_9FLOR|nr:hypothetical protein [Ophidocladus simpliciusculus]ARW66097.1 hypothetical protein [Ophidocladus simpliciusculus]